MPMANRGRTKLIEESSEVIQVLAKADAVYGLDNEHWQDAELGTLRERLEQELGDLQAAIAFIVEKEGLNKIKIGQRRHKKLTLFRQWDAEKRN